LEEFDPKISTEKLDAFAEPTEKTVHSLGVSYSEGDLKPNPGGIKQRYSHGGK